MKMNKTSEEEINVPIRDAIKDYNREQEILAQEAIDGKNTFANNIKDVLGEQIRTELAKKPKIAENVIEKKENKLKKFLDKLSSVCQ